jgi:hypothetical protein
MKLKTLLTSLLFITLVTVAGAQSSKKQDYSFNANSGSMLSIQNSFGDIDIEEFSGSKIEVNVEIIVEAKNDKNTKEYLSKIYIETKEEGNNVFLKTVNDVKGMNVKNFQINYDVRIPRNTHVKITNSFGDVKVQSISGSVNLSVQHGDCFVAKSEGDDNVLKVDFGDIRVIESGDIQIVSKHGDVSLGTIAHLKLNSQFGDVDVQDLRGDADINVMHGDLSIDKVGAKVQYMNVDVQFSDVEIEGLDDMDFKINLDGSFADFDFDDDWGVELSKKDYNLEGYVLHTNGSEASGTKSLRIKAQHSDVDLE